MAGDRYNVLMAVLGIGSAFGTYSGALGGGDLWEVVACGKWWVPQYLWSSLMYSLLCFSPRDRNSVFLL